MLRCVACDRDCLMHAESSLYFVLLREGEGRGVWELGGGREGGVVGGGGECESWEGEGSEKSR